MKDSPIHQPLVSVVVTSFNVADYLGECIRSIQAQTYSNLEIVVVDDCSTDESAAVIQSFAEKDSRIRLIRKARNEGALYAKLDGIRNTSGGFFFLCDGDDWISSELVSTCLHHAQTSDCVVFGIDFVDHATRTAAPNVYPVEIGEKIAGGIQLTNFEWGSINHMMQLYFYNSDIKSKYLEAYTNYPPLPYYEEIPGYALTMSLENRKVIPDVLYHYRLNRPGQSTANWWHANRSLKYLSLDTAISATIRSRFGNTSNVHETVFFKLLKIAFAEYRSILLNNPDEYPRLRRAMLNMLGRIETPERLYSISVKAALFYVALRGIPSKLTQVVVPTLLGVIRI